MFQKALAAFLAFLGPVAGSIQGFLTPAEVGRCVTAAFGAGSFVGGATVFLATLGADAAAVPGAPLGVALVACIAVHLSELLRRLGQSAPDAPVVAPTLDGPPSATFPPASFDDVLNGVRDGVISINQARSLAGLSRMPFPAPVVAPVVAIDRGIGSNDPS